jgi:tRNA threonylcarbamoyladenosine biosynthesis protein TsaE
MQEFRLTFNKQDIVPIAKKFLTITQGYKHFAFYGSLGAGKTTFIAAICNVLGTADLISSPTFAIVNEYSTFERIPIYHFDFYRIKSQVELLDIGFDEYCKEEAYCFIEWPEKGEGFIPDDFIKVALEEQPDGIRIITFLHSLYR